MIRLNRVGAFSIYRRDFDEKRIAGRLEMERPAVSAN